MMILIYCVPCDKTQFSICISWYNFYLAAGTSWTVSSFTILYFCCFFIFLFFLDPRDSYTEAYLEGCKYLPILLNNPDCPNVISAGKIGFNFKDIFYFKRFNVVVCMFTF